MNIKRALIAGVLSWLALHAVFGGFGSGVIPSMARTLPEEWAIVFALDPRVDGHVELWTWNPGERVQIVEGIVSAMIRRGYRLVETRFSHGGQRMRTQWELGPSSRAEFVRWASELLDKVDEVLGGLGGLAAGKRKRKK